MNILNLTQHTTTSEQQEAGVFAPAPSEKTIIQGLLTFDSLPSAEEILQRARELAKVADNALTCPECNAIGAYCGNNCYGSQPWMTRYALIGGAPYFMSALENALKERGITPLYAFSVRESVEEIQPDGSIKKVAIFRHRGFVKV